MKYQIPEDRIKKIVFKFFDTTPKLKNLVKYRINPGLYDFHNWTDQDDEFYDLDPPFRYYTEKYPAKWIAKSKHEYPKLQISHEIYREITNAFGENHKFLDLLKDWFEEKYHLPVKTLEY